MYIENEINGHSTRPDPISQSQEVPRRLGGIREVAELWRVEGPAIFFRHALQRYGSPFFNRLYVFEFDLARTASLEPLSQILPSGVTTRHFRGADDIERLSMLLAQVRPTYSAEQRLLRGDIATVALADEELVGYAWVTFRERWVSEIRATIAPQAGDVLGYDKRITPKWRGKGMQYALSVAMLQNLAEQGYRRLLSWVDALNTRSLKNQRRVGRRKVADIISIPPLRILRVRTCSPNDRIRIEKRTAISRISCELSPHSPHR